MTRENMRLCGNVYTWTDENGVTHFSDDPTSASPSQRGKVREIEVPDHPPPERPQPAPAEEPAPESPSGPSPYDECMDRVAKKKEELTKRLSENQQMLDGLGRNLEEKKTEEGGVQRTQRPKRDKPVRTRDKREYRKTKAQLEGEVQQTQEALKGEISRMEEGCKRLER